MQRENSQTPDIHDNDTTDELIDVIGLHGNQHLSDDVIKNGSSAATQTDQRTTNQPTRTFHQYDYDILAHCKQ